MAYYEAKLPLDWFTRPGTVTISPAALTMAKEFRDEIVRTNPGEDWVVCFDWADSRRARKARGSNEWIDLGSGLDLTGYERFKVPAEAIQVADGLEVLIKIAESVLKNSKRKLIDIDADTRTHLTVR